ncbi:MAG TPA: CaiB/BaiF CoA-transferase family protein [Myxococcaceae bacterium]|nr:CaiB/BaiF CoA-transferase family protein [Myxococcaceae bacterium]
MESPLSDLKVLDLSRLLPGPYATLVLAALGARVDKVEDPAGGDFLRTLPPLVDGRNPLFEALNRGKRSLALDLKIPAGTTAFRRLVRGYDLLVEGFRPGVMDRLGLSYGALRDQNPRLIYCSISGYGQSGPDRLKAGHDLNYLARAGVLGYGGEPGGPPAMPGVQIADIGSALSALIGLLSALHQRDRTGRGCHLDIALNEAALAFVYPQLAARLAAGSAGRPLSRGADLLNGGIANYNIYRTADGRYLSVGALEPKFFIELCTLLGRPDLLEIADLSPGRQEQIRRELAATFATKSLSEWVARLAGSESCVEPVYEGDEVLSDPQLRARDLFQEAPAGGEALPQLRLPLAMTQFLTEPAPELGEHSAEILAEAGFSQDEIRKLV